MKSCFAAAFLLLFYATVAAQELVSATLLGVRTSSELTSQFGLPMSFGAKFYRITYTTSDLQGMTDTVSGLVAVPDDPTRVYPRVVYQHGTAGSPLGVPSFNAAQDGEGSIGLLFAGLGYVALLPDYLGLGLSDGFHPYVHAASEAWVAADMLRALPAFNAQYDVFTNEQLFITGYSQGGHAAMALHREVETSLQDEFTVTAAAHLSGPYSIGEVMRDLILSDDIYYYPSYLPNTILSYQTGYGGLFDQMTDVFKEPYATAIGQFYTGAITLDQLNNQLIALLTTNEGAMADDQVPYLNSLLARDSMLARGAIDLVATDVDPTADHGGCVVPALTYTVFFFAGYQQVGTVTAIDTPVVELLQVWPNPAGATATLRNLPANGHVTVMDISGLTRMRATVSGGDQQLDVSGLENGLYLVQCRTAGRLWQGKMVVQR
ncbi:MAG: T9SS type A sorting domain-containing protein [Lewinellaceae bacterium]|nr:T9SS type A sorting domain-containing protein [Lewinellaceae bacterium]